MQEEQRAAYMNKFHHALRQHPSQCHILYKSKGRRESQLQLAFSISSLRHFLAFYLYRFQDLGLRDTE